MKILIVEDDENKLAQIKEFILTLFVNANVITNGSYQSGLKAIIQGGHDLIILDMTMPTFDIGNEEDGGRPQAYAGRDILLQMDRRGIVIPVIVVTQFDKFGTANEELTLKELDKLLTIDNPDSYVGAVYYSTSTTGWKMELKNILQNIGHVYDSNINS